MFMTRPEKLQLPNASRALPGRSEVMPLPPKHRIYGTPLDAPFPGMEVAYFGLGCFWGAERLFWRLPGVVSTAVGYQGGFTPNPTYEEVCSGLTGHTEAVRVVFDPTQITYADLLKAFWEAHDPTQGMRQGNDVGTQYRSALYATIPEQLEQAQASRAAYEASLQDASLGTVTTELIAAPTFYFAEPYHQQYLDANPNGYCGLKGTGVACVLGGR